MPHCLSARAAGSKASVISDFVERQEGWGKGVMVMRHLRLTNGAGLETAAQEPNAEYCLLDYSSCQQSDVCWLADMDNNCSSSDGCIIDIS